MPEAWPRGSALPPATPCPPRAARAALAPARAQGGVLGPSAEESHPHGRVPEPGAVAVGAREGRRLQILSPSFPLRLPGWGGDPRPHDRTFLAVSAIGRVSEQLPDHVGPRLPAPARQRAVLQACRTSTHRRVEAAPREGWRAPRPRPPSRTRPRNASAGREAGPSRPDGRRVHRQPLPGRPPHRCSPAQSPGLRPFAVGGGLPPGTAGPSCPSPLEASARAAPAASRRGSCFRLLLLFFRGDAAVASGSVTSEGEPLLGDQA